MLRIGGVDPVLGNDNNPLFYPCCAPFYAVYQNKKKLDKCLSTTTRLVAKIPCVNLHEFCVFVFKFYSRTS